MVGRRAKGRKKLLSGWLRVLIAKRGAYRPSIEQINRIGRLVGASQCTQQEEVLRPVWTDNILNDGRGR